jgi:predicted transcriptional regulator
MDARKINDKKLIRLIDSGKTQADAARDLGVSRQAVSKRLNELRGRTTRVVVAQPTKKIIDQRFDAIEQLGEINKKSLELLEQAEEKPEFALKCIGEVRNQIRLAADIQMHLFSVQEAQKFMAIVKEALKEASPDAYKEFLRRINHERTLRSTLRFT